MVCTGYHRPRPGSGEPRSNSPAACSEGLRFQFPLCFPTAGPTSATSKFTSFLRSLPREEDSDWREEGGVLWAPAGIHTGFIGRQTDGLMGRLLRGQMQERSVLSLALEAIAFPLWVFLITCHKSLRGSYFHPLDAPKIVHVKMRRSAARGGANLSSQHRRKKQADL